MKLALVVPVRNSKFFLTIELVVMPESWGLQIGGQLNTLDWKDDSYMLPEENCLFVKEGFNPEFLGI